jgi:hypothetical protein
MLLFCYPALRRVGCAVNSTVVLQYLYVHRGLHAIALMFGKVRGTVLLGCSVSSAAESEFRNFTVNSHATSRGVLWARLWPCNAVHHALCDTNAIL